MFEDERRGLPLRQLGWAFLLAWVFCVFYTSAAGALSEMRGGSSAPLVEALFYNTFPLAASVATLVAIVIAEPRLGAPTAHRGLVLAAPVLTAASTPFMFLTVPDPVLNAVLFAAGSVATGLGSALLWVMWGEYYAVLPRDKTELLAPVSAVSAALLVLLVSAMEGWVSLAVTSAFPLLSGVCFHLAWTRDAACAEQRLVRLARAQAPAGLRRPLAGLGRTGAGILVVFAIVSIAGMMYESPLEGTALQVILVFSALMMALVAVLAVSGPRRISLVFLYRWMCPTLVIGLSALVLFGTAGGLLTAAASLAGRFTFCLIAQIYFANYAAAGRATPAQASSLGWLFVHAGDLAGVTLWVVIAPTLAALPNGLVWAATLCIVALVTATMAVMNESSIFLRMPERCEAPDSAAKPAEAPGTEGGTAAVTRAEAVSPDGSLVRDGALANTKVEVPLLDDPSVSGAGVPEPRVGERTANSPVDALAAAHGLTPREAEVFALLAQGRSIPYIRDELIISRETAATHAKHIYAKLGVHSRQELIDLVQNP